MGRYIDTSLCKSQDQQNHSLIIHDKFEDLFTTITKISRFLPQWYRCMKTSNARKCTKPLAQRYKAKQVLRQKLNKVNQAFWFSIFMCFLDFWHKKKKIDQKTKTKTKTRSKVYTNRQENNHQHKQQAINQTSSQSIRSINAWTCCNAYAWVPFFTHTSLAFGVISL